MATYSTFLSVSGQELEKAYWPCEGQPKAVIQLVHGMCEHIHRYEATAEKLVQAGFAVVGHTHLGHGRYAQQEGYFADRNGWDMLIEDVHTLRKETQRQFPGVPYYLLGHSMGSFVVRGYCLKYEEGLAGVILSGTGHYDKPVVLFGRALSALQKALGMGRKPARLIKAISFGGNNKTYQDVQTPNDWLSRDREVVKRYMDDPLCGFTFTVSAYADMFEGLSRLFPQKLDAMLPDVPILMISGDQDPIGGYGKGVRQVAQELSEAGVKQVDMLLYAGGRHEMFGEINRETVWADLIYWLNQQIQ